jgi:energy-coupling factor transporter transmembrane protein EcfT
MITARGLHLPHLMVESDQKLGTVGYLAIFLWSVVTVMVTPARLLPWVAGLCLLVAALVYPSSYQRILRWRWLLMIILLALPSVFLVGELDRSLGGIRYSSEGLTTAVQIVARVLVILISVEGFTSSVDISSVGGLLERAGLHGLGFSIGVALNLLPALQQSALNAWRSLWMRGGLRKKRWRGLRLLFMTIMGNALGRAEEIALAAEARAYTPERSRALPVKVGKWDRVVVVVCAIGMLVVVLIP